MSRRKPERDDKNYSVIIEDRVEQVLSSPQTPTHIYMLASQLIEAFKTEPWTKVSKKLGHELSGYIRARVGSRKGLNWRLIYRIHQGHVVIVHLLAPSVPGYEKMKGIAKDLAVSGGIHQKSKL